MADGRCRLVVIVALGAGLLVACGPKYHTAARYRFDREIARRVVDQARACCARTFPADQLPTRPFLTDGCSLWPDGVWQRCCVEHDMRYWCGGSRAMRRRADRLLRECVAAEWKPFGPAMGWSMQRGVGIGGSPLWPTYYRWGYGRPWSGRYRDAPVDAASTDDACEDLHPLLRGASW
jgi:hypothetical protein